MRTALYIRVSTQEQADSGDSLREQEETLTAYAKSHNLTIYGIYKDEGISGQKNDRDGLNRLMKDVRAGHIQMILFTKLDRWFRSMRHYLNTQAELEKYGVVWKAVSQDYYDTTTTYGKTFVNLTMTFAELEAQNTSDRIKATFASKEANGEVLSGKCPIGYRIENKHLVVDPEKAEIAIATFKHYDETNSLNDTVRFLKSEYGINRTQAALKDMLRNERYVGRRKDNNNFCDAIIETELFASVQTKLRRNIRSDATRTYLFSGLMVCAECGKKLTPIMQQTKSRGKVYKYMAYKCRGRVLHECSNPKIILETTAERALLDYVRNDMPDIIIDRRRRAKTADYQKQREAIAKKLTRLKDLYIDGDIDKATYTKRKDSLETELNKITPDDSQKMPEELEKQILDGTFGEKYTALDRAGKRNLWQSMLQQITLDKHKKVRFYFR